MRLSTRMWENAKRVGARQANPLFLMTQFAMLLLLAVVGGSWGQNIRTQNSSMLLEVAGATLALTPTGSCATSPNNNALLQSDLQAALVAGVAAAANTQFSTQIAAVNSTAALASAPFGEK